MQVPSRTTLTTRYGPSQVGASLPRVRVGSLTSALRRTRSPEVSHRGAEPILKVLSSRFGLTMTSFTPSTGSGLRARLVGSLGSETIVNILGFFGSVVAVR
ncbi:hypothetical protein BHM03_00011087 [Ensete ventricosum]|nr:hypothetical protein BHM03_00011087 [Ensete ventricosum]